MRNITKLNILFLLISFMLSGCNRTQCIEADDFGFASVTVSARYPNNNSTKYINNYQNKDMGAWLDTGYFLTGAPLTLMVSNWKWNRNLGVTSNNTGAYLSAWSPWFGSAKYYNYLPASIVSLRSCTFGTSNSTTCFAQGTPDVNRITNAPCLMTQGIGLYGLLQTPGATSPNTSVTSQASPSGYSFHVGAKENNAALFDASGAAGGIVVSNPNYQDISNYTGGKLFLKILDVNYGDNAGQYIVKIKSGVRNLGVDPFKAFADKFQQIIFAGNGTTPGIVPTIYGNILTQTGFLKAVKAILTLYIFFTGAGFLIGIVQLTAWEVLNRVIKILIIGALLSPNSWSYFSSYLFNIFMYGSNQIIGMIEYAATGGYASGGESIMALLFAEETLAKLSSVLWMDFTGIMYFIMFVFLILLVTYIYLKAWIFFITAFLFVGVMLSLTPIFLCFMLFGWTNHLYKGWIDKLIAYSMQPIILFAALAFLGSMIRSEIYNTLGFKVCLHNVFNMTITDNSYSLLKMYYPEPVTLGATKNIAVPKPWTRSNGQQCRAYECQDNRYLQLPYLDPNSPQDAARISAFASGTYIHLDALFYLIITAIIMLFFNDSALAIATGIFGGGLSATAANAAAKGVKKYAGDAAKYVARKASAAAAKNFRDSLRGLGLMKETEKQRKERIAKEKAEGKTTFSKLKEGFSKASANAKEGLSKTSANAKAGWHKFKEGANPNSETNIKNKMSAATKKRVDAKTALDEAKARQAKLIGLQEPSKQNKLSSLFQKSPDAQIAKLQKNFDKAQKSEMGIISKLKTASELKKDHAKAHKELEMAIKTGDKDKIHQAQQKALNLLNSYNKAQQKEDFAKLTISQKILGTEGAAKLAARNPKIVNNFAKLKANSVELNDKITKAFKGKTSEELGKELEQSKNKLDVYYTSQEVSKLRKDVKVLQNDLYSTDKKESLLRAEGNVTRLQKRMEGRRSIVNFMSGDSLRFRFAKSTKEKLSKEVSKDIERANSDKYGADKAKLLSDTWGALAKAQGVLDKNPGLAMAGRNLSDKEITKAEREVLRLTKAHDAAKQGEEARKSSAEKRSSDLAAKQTARDEERASKIALALDIQGTTERNTLQTRVVENVRKQVAASAKLDAARDKRFSRFNPVGKRLNDEHIKNLESKLGKYQDRQDYFSTQVKDEDAGKLSGMMEGARVDAIRQNYSNAVRDIINISKDKVRITDQLYAADKQRAALESQVAKLSQSLDKSKDNVIMHDIYQYRLDRASEALDKNINKTIELQSKYSNNSQKEERLLSLRTDDISSAYSRAQGAADPKLQQIVDKNVIKATEQTSKALTALYEGYTSGKSGKELEKLQQSYAEAKDNERQTIARGASMGVKPTLDLSDKPLEALQKRMEQDQAKMDVRAAVANPDALAGAKQTLESQKSRMANLTEVQSVQKQLAKAEAGHNKLTGELNKIQERAESLKDNRGNMGMVQLEVLSKQVADDRKRVDSVRADIAKYQGQIKQQQEFLAKPENQDAVKFLSQNQISKGVGQLQDQLALSGAQKQVAKLEGEQKSVEKFTSGFEGFKDFMANQKTESAPVAYEIAQSSTSSPVGGYGIAELAQRASAPMLSPQLSNNSAVASAFVERSAQSSVPPKSTKPVQPQLQNPKSRSEESTLEIVGSRAARLVIKDLTTLRPPGRDSMTEMFISAAWSSITGNTR